MLLLLLAAEGVTILQLGRLLTLHFFIGMLLLGPVALKAGSTMYRFARYYTGSAPYRRKGPPAPLLRLLGPVVIASTAGVFGSGIVLAVAGPANREPWLFLHKGSFVVPLQGYAGQRYPGHGDQRYPGQYAGRAADVLGGRGVRLSLLAASLLAGLVIAVLTVHLAAPWHIIRFH